MEERIYETPRRNDGQHRGCAVHYEQRHPESQQRPNTTGSPGDFLLDKSQKLDDLEARLAWAQDGEFSN
ncbi:hypothetical protein DPV78_001130 [Talaromyces pinophilus]|nr:hypothetical protein DPV78_001130 [Talaromyces pinophilus]